MKKKCPNCNLINFATAANCLRCESALVEVASLAQSDGKKSFLRSKFFKRAVGCVAAIIFTLLGFYLSLVLSAKPLQYEEKKAVERAILILEDKGFSKEVFMLRYLTVFRGNDNWLNASTREENAYAATNFPFEIMTIYPDFFMYPKDDAERAAILLHEARHLKGADEREAYQFVWKNRKKLGWTKETHGGSIVWRNVRKQTKEIVPKLFVCEVNEFADCTE